MNDGISRREFARRENCSEGLVRRAVNSGKLATYEDGTISPDLVGSGWRKSNVVDLPERPKGAHTGAYTGAQVYAPTGVGAPDDGEQDTPIEERAKALIEAGVVTLLPYGEATTKKENYIALLRELEFQEKAGLVVSLELAERALFEGARAFRDAWLNWPSRVGPLIAADLGLEADKVTEALTEHVHKHIAQLGEPDVHFHDNA